MKEDHLDIKEDTHSPIKMDMLDALHKRRDFYLNELLQLEEYEKKFKDEIQKPTKFRKKELFSKMGVAIWFQLIHEFDLLYTILYQLVEHLEKDMGKIEALEKNTEFYSDKGIRWVLDELQRGLTRTQLEKKDFGEKVE